MDKRYRKALKKEQRQAQQDDGDGGDTMKWTREKVNRENSYVDAVIGFWDIAYQTNDADIIIVKFCDEPGVYYLRTYQTEEDYSRATCLPTKFMTLEDAKTTAEMMVLTGIVD